MSLELTGVVGIVVLIALFFAGVPIAFAMTVVGGLGFAYLNGAASALVLLAQDVFEVITSYPLSVIPMFILMGSFAFSSGISQRLYETSYKWVGHRRGGLTVSTVLACSSFAAICGSTVATAATMGRIALPEMKKYGYKDVLATGTVAASGTLGILIPPSTVLIVYGILTEDSIGKLFMAGLVPGFILTIFFVVTVLAICKKHPDWGPPGPPVPWPERLKSLTGVVDSLVIFSFTIGGLMVGWFSPTQAGAIGASSVLALSVVRGTFSLRSALAAAKDGLRTSCMVLFIFVGGVVFSHFLTLSNIPYALGDWVEALNVSPLAIIGIIVLIYFVGGFFMDSMGLIVVTIPIFHPIVTNLGFDSIWFGILIVLICEIGVITPPVGVNVFVINGIAPDVPLQTIFRGIFPFLWALIILTAVICIFPNIITFLPSLLQ